MAKIIWLDKAIADLDEALEYIALDNPKAAKNLASKMIQKIDRLEIFPLSGKKPKEKLNPDYLEIVIQPFRVFYIFNENNDTVYIADVFSSRQDIHSLMAKYIVEEKHFD